MNKSQIIKDLKSVRKIVANKKTWCKNASAVNKDGEEVSATSKTAVQWCLLGSISKVANTTRDVDRRQNRIEKLENLLVDVADVSDASTLATINDSNGGRLKVVKLLDKAIKSELESK